MAKSDFKKTPDPKPTDDQSPTPVLPMANIAPDVPAIEEDQVKDDIEDQKKAQAAWHPAFETIKNKLEGHLEAYRTNGAKVHEELSAEEFKIRLLVDAHVADILEEVIEDVTNAVEAVEQQPNRPKPSKRPTTGA